MADIRVSIIEDDHDIRRLLKLIIDGSAGFECKNTYESCESGISKVLSFPPDILLMDIDLPGMSGIQGVEKIRESNEDISILMLTIHEESNYIFDSLCKGANGYLLKGIPPVDLLNALKDAYGGGAPMSPEVAVKVVSYFQRKPDFNLTNRELEILKLLCEGENYSTIASKLFISKNTVKGHIKNIYKKLHVHSRAEAVLKAHRSGLL